MEKKENLFLVQDKSNYFFSIEEACIQPIIMKGANLYIRKICEILKIAIPEKFLNQQLYNGNNVIFTDTAFHIGTIKACIKFYGKEHCYLYYLNTINDLNIKFCKYFKEKNIYTFDYMDAQNYGLKYKHTPYSNKLTLLKTKIEYDVLFLGREKGREEIIYEIYLALKSRGFRTKFLVLGSSNKEFRLEKYLDYQEYLSLCAKSKSIVEINKIGQYGCSLRMLESLFFEKKLITNNLGVYKDDYYNSNNIFVWGSDDINRIADFIDSPYIADKDLTQLMFQNWVKSF